MSDIADTRESFQQFENYILPLAIERSPAVQEALQLGTEMVQQMVDPERFSPKMLPLLRRDLAYYLQRDPTDLEWGSTLSALRRVLAKRLQYEIGKELKRYE